MVPAIDGSDEPELAMADEADADEAIADVADADVADADVAVADVVVEGVAVADVTTAAVTDPLEIDFELVDMTPRAPVAVLPERTAVSVPSPPHNGLGFIVEYGTPAEPIAPDLRDFPDPIFAPPVSVRIPTPPAGLARHDDGNRAGKPADRPAGHEGAPAPVLPERATSGGHPGAARPVIMPASRTSAPAGSRGRIVAVIGIAAAAIAAAVGWLLWSGRI